MTFIYERVFAKLFFQNIRPYLNYMSYIWKDWDNGIEKEGSQSRLLAYSNYVHPVVNNVRHKIS